MKSSNTVRIFFSTMFALFVILAVTVIPVAADDEPSLTSTLYSINSNDPEKLAPNQVKKVTYILDFPLGADLGVGADPEQDPLPYAFNITISNPNSTFGPLSNLILNEDAAKFDADEFKINDTMNSVIGSNNIVYYFDELPARGSISFQLNISGKDVYPNETTTITATLSQVDVNGEGAPIVNCTNEIIVDYSLSSTNLVSLADFSLVQPLLLPTGENGKSIFVLAESFLRYSENMTGPNSSYYYYSYVVDFSGVDITIDGVTKTYSSWISGATSVGEAPVYFVPVGDKNVSNLTSLSIGQFSASVLNNTSITLLSSDDYDFASPSYKYDSNNASFPFLIIINKNFTNGSTYPSINLKNVSVDVKLMVNNKGEPEELGFYPNGTTVFSGSTFSTEGPALTWGGGHSLDLNVYPYNTKINPVGGSAVDVGHLLNNSSNENEDRFKYQELFTMSLINAVPGDVTITVEIDDNVTLTHLRIPGPDPEYSKYGAVTVMNGSGTEVTGFTVTSGRNAILLNLETLDGITFNKGEDITLKFTNFEYIKSGEGSPLNFTDTNLIDFVGMTHETAATNVTFNVTAKYDDTHSGVDESYYNFTEGYFTNSTLSYELVENYSITVSNSGIRFSGDGISNNVVNEWDYPFYMDMDISPSNYPYLGAYRANPLDPFNTTSLPNPAVYFIVPDSLKYIQGSVTIVDKPNIFLDETIVPTANGEVVVVRIGNETVPGSGVLNTSTSEKYLLNESITVRFAVSVSDTFKNDTLEVPPYTLLGGSWDPTAAGLSGVWNTHTISLGDSRIDPDDDLNSLHLVPYGTYYGAPTLTSPEPCLSKNVKVYAKNATSLDLTQNPNRGVSSNAPEFGANFDTNGVFTLNLKSKDMDESPSDATAIFVLPNGSFTPTLTGISVLDGSDIPDGVSSNFSLQYTIKPLNPGLEKYDTTAWEWKPATYNSGSKTFTLEDTDDLSKITAVKLNVTDYQGVLNLSMPFHVSNLSKPLTWSNTAILGQTLYEFEGSTHVNKGYTPAIKYKPTALPTVMWVNSDGSGPTSNPASASPAGLGDSFNYHFESDVGLPKWNEIYISDDDSYLGLKSVKVTFRPITGSSEDLIFIEDLVSSDTTGSYQSNFTITDSDSKVNLQKAGRYTVTYVTTPDIDNRTATTTYVFNVVKDIGTITLDNPDVEVEFFMGSHADIFDDLSDLSWMYDPNETIGIDANGGDPIDLKPTNFVLESDPSRPANFFEVPGNYSLKYVYSDSTNFGNNMPINVTMIVKYTGTLTIDAKLGTENITDFTNSIGVNVAIDGGAGTPATLSGDQYTFTLEADSSTPTRVLYDITVNGSTLPVGLKMPIAISGTGGIVGVQVDRH